MGTHTSKSSAMSMAGNPTVSQSPDEAYVGWMKGYSKLVSDIESPLNISLNGSEKQQSYANDIVNRAVTRAMTEDARLRLDKAYSDSEIENQIRFWKERNQISNASDMQKGFEVQAQRKAPVLQATKQAISKALDGITSASEVIDKRDGFSQYGKVSQAIRQVRSKFERIHAAGREFTIDAAARHIKKAYDES